MSRFDLNKLQDFETLTMSRATALLNAFARDQTEWAISEGTYTGGRRAAKPAVFHVFKSKQNYQAGLPRIVDGGGRRKAKFVFPYVDGQTTDDLGRKAGFFDVEIVFHGPRYKVGLNRLFVELNDPIPGTLEHPVRGTLRCGMVDFSIEHSADMRQAAMVRVRFEEHNFETAAFKDITVIVTPKSALQKTIAAIQAMAAAIAAVKQIKGALTGLVTQIRDQMIETYNTAVNITADAASAFGQKGFDVGAILPLATGGLLAPFTVSGVTVGGVSPLANFGASPSTASTAGTSGLATTSGGFIRVSTRFTTIIAPSDPFANLPIELLSDVAREAIELTQLGRRNEIMRQMAAEISTNVDTAIAATQNISGASVGRAAGSLEALVRAKIAALDVCATMVDVLRSGSANGRPAIISYTVPRPMSIREAAFLNGLTPQEGADISLLNPRLESTNWIAKGTVLKVPAFI